ncbi:hypothetical protein Cci01nite_61930 [Catellatospora citrea]|uniref:Uncharacterized protein n=1 Tax=Catellatospora citrea TaxID=53366 RepID=A0A8J3KI00_9ACTN|nr:hypothetical protein C8E86_5684 [Catellatospora citrea]GIG01100.1 hypothetical protein Cci01nite_61930 [Catellatospora citrea]
MYTGIGQSSIDKRDRGLPAICDDHRLIRLPAGEWLDIVDWNTPEDFAESRRRGGDRPGIQAFFSLIDEVISSEEGTTTEAVQR